MKRRQFSRNQSDKGSEGKSRDKKTWMHSLECYILVGESEYERNVKKLALIKTKYYYMV